MQVTISVPGTFHAFDLAEGLYDHNMLDQVYTSYPYFKLSTDLPSSKITTIPAPELIYQFGKKLEIRNKVNKYSSWNSPFLRWKFRLFDKLVARKLSPAKDKNAMFIGFAGSSLSSIQEANSLGYTTAVERSSVDIRTQRNLLSREFDRLKGYSNPISERHIEIEEEEYDEADYIIVPSKYATDSFNSRGFDEKVVDIPLGSDPARTMTSRSTRPDSISDNEDVFLYVGAVSAQKGIDYLLQAWTASDINNAHLVLAGEVNAEMKSQIKNTGESVHAVGWQNNIDEWYAGADYFVFPSMQDGFGRAVIEALFHGLPSIVSSNTGAKDCIREGIDGYTFVSGDASQIQKKMVQLIKNDWEPEKISKYAKIEYSLDGYILRVIDAYRRMIANNGPFH